MLAIKIVRKINLFKTSKKLRPTNNVDNPESYVQF